MDDAFSNGDSSEPAVNPRIWFIFDSGETDYCVYATTKKERDGVDNRYQRSPRREIRRAFNPKACAEYITYEEASNKDSLKSRGFTCASDKRMNLGIENVPEEENRWADVEVGEDDDEGCKAPKSHAVPLWYVHSSLCWRAYSAG